MYRRGMHIVCRDSEESARTHSPLGAHFVEIWFFLFDESLYRSRGCSIIRNHPLRSITNQKTRLEFQLSPRHRVGKRYLVSFKRLGWSFRSLKVKKRFWQRPITICKTCWQPLPLDQGRSRKALTRIVVAKLVDDAPALSASADHDRLSIQSGVTRKHPAPRSVRTLCTTPHRAKLLPPLSK